MERKKTIVFTGGHHNSALQVAKELKTKGYTIIWYGHKQTSEGDKNLSQEYRDVTSSKIPFVNVKSGKIYGGGIIAWLKTLKAIILCVFSFTKQKPTIIMAFGGYLAVPPVIAGWLLGIPTLSHEQTRTLGLANKVLLPLLTHLYLAWPLDTLTNNPKVSVIGLPLPDSFLGSLKKKSVKEELLRCFTNPHKPLLVISGGKQGSHAINCAVEASLDQLLFTWNVFHQAGNNSQTKDLERLEARKNVLSDNLKGSYCVTGYSQEFKEWLKVADVIIGRSGAHTVYEALLLKKKFVAIPLPFSFGKEQHKNAQLLVDLGLGKILPQDKLTTSTLINTVNEVYRQPVDVQALDKYVKNNVKTDATQTLVHEIETYIT